MTSSYQAKIDLIVTGLEKIKAAETRIKNLVSESKKLKRGGTAQRGTVALATVTRTERQASQRSVRIAERKLTLQSKLNSATDLYNRKLREFTRSGGESNDKLKGRVDQIKQAFQVGTRGGQKNIRLARALATELGRVVEKQRESNRLQTTKNKGVEESRRGFERIEALQAGGLSKSNRLSSAKKLVRGIVPAARTGDQVAYNEAVRKAKVVLSRLERDYKKASAAQKASTKAKRDVERAEKRLAAETKKAETASAARRRARKQKFTDVATGFGFPLLFGGGPVQALAGGIGGAAGGLGGSIAASAIAAQIEQVLKTSAELGQALNPLTLDLERVAEASGFAGTETQKFMQKIEQYGEATEAARLATALLETKVGKDGVKALKDFGEDAVTLGNNLSVIFTQVLANIAKAAGPLLNSLAKFAGEQADVGAFLARGPGTSQEKLAQQILKTNFTSIKGELTTSSSKALQEFSERSVGLGGQGFKTAAEAKTFATGVASSSQRRVEQPVLQEIEKLAGTLGPEEKTKKGRKSRLPQLQIEIGLQERLLGLNTRIAEAKRAGNEGAAAVLEVEKIFEKTAANINKIKLESLNKDEETAKIRSEELKGLQQVESINNRMRDLAAQKAENAANTIQQLEDTLELSQAIGREEKNRLEIEQKLKKLEKAGMEGPQLAQAKSLMQQINNENAPLNQFIKQSTDSLNDLEATAVRVSQGIGNAIGGSLVNGLQGLVTGATSVKQVFADMLKSVADVLAKTAAQMIAQYIAIGIAKAFALGASAGNSSSPAPASKVGAAANLPGPTGDFGLGAGPSFGSVSDFKPATILPAQKFAEGGFVSSPTNALIGEGGEPEYVIPESKMRESMARYSRGSRGGGVIPESSGGGAESGGEVAVAAPIDVRYTVERINSVDYVTADQFQRGMRQAATQGAREGEQQTLKRLQMSSSTRRRLGM